MSQSQTPLSENSEEKNLGRPFYKSLVSIDESEIIVDPYSLKLLEKGDIEQRYAVVGYVYNNKLYLHFRPSFPQEFQPADDSKEAKDEFLLKAPRAQKFDLKDIVFAPPTARGVVHEETNKSVRIRYLSGEAKTEEVMSEIQMGLSVAKESEDLNRLNWVNRSTRNYDIFAVDPVARLCFYFEPQQNFVRPKYTRVLHLDRSLEQGFFEKIIFAVRKKVLKENSPQLDKDHNDLLVKIRKVTDLAPIKEWELIRDDKDAQAKLIMRTIFIAAGLNGEPDHFQSANSEIIFRAIETAKKYGIRLNLNLIPENFDFSPEEIKCTNTALINACLMGDSASVKFLLNYDNSKEVINYANIFGETALMTAIIKGDLFIAGILLDKGADASEELKIAIINNRVNEAQEIVKNMLKKQYQSQQLKNYVRERLENASIKETKPLFEFMSTYGFTLGVSYAEDTKETYEDLLISKLRSGFLIKCAKGELPNIKEIALSCKDLKGDIFKKVINSQLDEKYINAGNSALMEAILLKSSSPVDSPDLPDDLPDFLADDFAAIDRKGTIRWLLEEGIDTSLQNNKGETALMLAIKENDLETVEQILKYSTTQSLKLTDNQDQSALAIAVSTGNLDILNLLLTNPAILQILMETEKMEAKVSMQQKNLLASSCIDFINSKSIDPDHKIELLNNIIAGKNALGKMLSPSTSPFKFQPVNFLASIIEERDRLALTLSQNQLNQGRQQDNS